MRILWSDYPRIILEMSSNRLNFGGSNSGSGRDFSLNSGRQGCLAEILSLKIGRFSTW